MPLTLVEVPGHWACKCGSPVTVSSATLTLKEVPYNSAVHSSDHIVFEGWYPLENKAHQQETPGWKPG